MFKYQQSHVRRIAFVKKIIKLASFLILWTKQFIFLCLMQKSQYLQLQLSYVILELDKMWKKIKFQYNVVFLENCFWCLFFYGEFFFLIWIFSAIACIIQPCQVSVIYYYYDFLLFFIKIFICWFIFFCQVKQEIIRIGWIKSKWASRLVSESAWILKITCTFILCLLWKNINKENEDIDIF